MRALKALAEELKVPILVVFELSQIVERQDKRPIMSDLREFGSIAQAADLVLFIHREEVDFPENLDARGKAEVIIGRQRNGPTGTVNLTFLNQGAAFERQVSEESVR
jgi:replicative DNA helicase